MQPTIELHDYQLDATEWLIKNQHAGLFLPPGLGKTSIALKTFQLLKSQGIVDKMLVIAPIRVCYLSWPGEINKWQDFRGLTYTVLHGPKKDAALNEKSDIYLINPDGLQWLAPRIGYLMKDSKWMLMVDEVSNFKNSTSQRFKILRKLLDRFIKRSILTGTPAPNGLMNLWAEVYLLDKGQRLGAYKTTYRNEFFYPAGWMGYEYRLRDGGEAEIYRRVDDIIMHKSRDEINMPGLLKNYIEVDLPPAARRSYEEMRLRLLTEIDPSTIVASTAAVKSGKLKQIANGSVYDEHGVTVEIHKEKINAITELSDGLEGKPLLVFYEYKHDLAALKKAFPKAPHLGGGVVGQEAEQIVNDWNAGQIPVLLLHPASAGHGLNLQSGGCQDVCWFSITWDLELHEQGIGRVWRQGASGAVTSHYITSRRTIDQHILRVLDGKATTQDALLDALKK